jgi:hypothetical protein
MMNTTTESLMTESELVLKMLRAELPGTENSTKYISCFSDRSGRQIAIEKKRTTGIYVWVEKYDSEIDGAEVRNRSTPGMPYSGNQSRNSNLNDKTASRLKVGNKVWYLKIDSLEAFKQFFNGYVAH